MWWSAVVYQLKHRLLTTRKAGVWLSIGPSTLNGNKICTATVLATFFYVTFCLGASCLRLDLHCILTAVPQTPNNPAPMTQIILHQPHRTPKKLLPLISVCPLIYCPLKLEETSIEPLHMRSSPKHNNIKSAHMTSLTSTDDTLSGTVIQLRENIRNYSNRGLSAVPFKFFVANDLHKRL